MAVYVINNRHFGGLQLAANKYHSIDIDCVKEHSLLVSNQTFCYSKHQITCFNHMQYCYFNTTVSCFNHTEVQCYILGKTSSWTGLSILLILFFQFNQCIFCHRILLVSVLPVSYECAIQLRAITLDTIPWFTERAMLALKVKNLHSKNKQ